MNDIYVRVSDSERVVEFVDSWSDISLKKGKKKKFKSNDKRKILRYVVSCWRNYTTSEIKKWKAPNWLKEEHYRINNKNNVYVTVDNEGYILIEFEMNKTVIRIKKIPMFYELYDRYFYIYEKILSIAQSADFNDIKIHTDLVELLRINRIYWKDMSYEVKAYVYIDKYENLPFKI